jgi:hypothetical protein
VAPARKKTEATEILGEDFAGIGVADDYAAYKSMFNQHQLCWAHSIRKAIELALKNPGEPEYNRFLDGLCGIYHDAKQQRAPAPTGDVDADTIQRLQDRVTQLCTRSDEVILTAKAAEKAGPTATATTDAVATFVLLQRELVENLFVCVRRASRCRTDEQSQRTKCSARDGDSQGGADERNGPGCETA